MVVANVVRERLFELAAFGAHTDDDPIMNLCEDPLSAKMIAATV